MSAPLGSRLLDQDCTFATLSDELDLDVRIKKGLARLGYVRPTLVQRQCLTLSLSQGRDLLVRARTGTGKTLAYCLPILEKILRFHKLQQAEGKTRSMSDKIEFVKAVILVPTRELCDQVYSTLKGLMYYCDDVASVAVLGGTMAQQTSKGEDDTNKSEKVIEMQQEAMLRDKPDIIVSTPAGLWRLVKDGKVHLKNSVESLVVDEADLVLSFGYTKDVENLTRHLPKICQGFLMSATLTPELDSLKKIVLHSPAILKLEEEDIRSGEHNSSNLSQFFLPVPKQDKRLVLYVFLKLGLLKGKGLFFVNSINGAYRLKLFLEKFYIRTIVLNSELPLSSRLSILNQFNVGNFDYLIATDEGNYNTATENKESKSNKKHSKKRKKDSEYGVSRGVDFQGVSFVVNYDFPTSSDSYTHRVGRTARGGSKGVALSFVETESEEQYQLLELVQSSQPPLPITQGTHDNHLTTDTTESENFIAQPSLLNFNLKEIEGFRYRVEDVGRAVTSIAVQEARAAEVKAEMLNSEKLMDHFSDNPHDLHMLRHDRQTTHATKMQDHLKHVPKYLLPKGMQVAHTGKKKRKRKKLMEHRSRYKNQKDPLKSFSGNVNLDGVADASDKVSDYGDGGGESDDEMEEEEQVNFGPDADEDDDSPYNEHEYGRSTSNSRRWKMQHKKGKYSKKNEKRNAKQAGTFR